MTKHHEGINTRKEQCNAKLVTMNFQVANEIITGMPKGEH